MQSVLITDAMRVVVAVAVSAITCTVEGIILGISPSLENAVRKVSPLQGKVR